jgi:hypothetical protein
VNLFPAAPRLLTLGEFYLGTNGIHVLDLFVFVSFKQLDLNEGMPDEYTGRFDIAYCRVVLVHVSIPPVSVHLSTYLSQLEDPPKMVNDLVRCLKPGKSLRQIFSY